MFDRINFKYIIQILSLFMSSQVMALPITWDFTAIVSPNINQSEYFKSNDTWGGRIVFEGDTAGQRGMLYRSTIYWGALMEISMWNSTTSITFDVNDDSNRISIENVSSGYLDSLNLGLSNVQASVVHNGLDVITDPYSDFGLSLRDYDGLVFDSGELLMTPPDLSFFETRGLYVELGIDGIGVTSGFLLTSIEKSVSVPEPSSLLLVLLGVALIFIKMPNKLIQVDFQKGHDFCKERKNRDPSESP